MKQVKSHIIIIVLFLLTGQGLLAQEDGDSKIRMINLEVLHLLDEYERESDIFKQKDYYRFSRIFKSEESNIANDVLPDNKLNEQITVEEYPKKLNEYYTEIDYSSGLNVQYLSPVTFTSDTSGHLTAFAEKTIRGKNKYDVLYADTLLYEFKIRFNGLGQGNYKITEIKIDEPQGKYCLVEAYRKPLLGKKLMKEEDLIINQDTLSTNEKGRILLKDVNKDFELKTVDENIYEIEEIQVDEIGEDSGEDRDKNLAKVDFKEPFLYWKAELEYMGSPPVTLEQKEHNISVTSTEINYSAGAKIGVILGHNQWSRYLLSSGVFYSDFQYQLGMKQYYEKDEDATDPDGDDYTRNIRITGIEESHELTMLSFPLMLTGEFQVSRKFYLDLGAGIRYFVPIKAVAHKKANGNYSGTYDQYFDVTIEEKGIYDFGRYDLDFQNQSLSVSSNLLAWKTNAGVKYQLSRREFLNVDFTLMKSFNPMFDEEQKILSENKDELNSLTSLEDSFILDNWSINVGYLIKF